MKKVLFIVAVATLFFSCQKELEPTNSNDSGKGFTFTAGIENLATKADINTSNELVWAAGDKIGIYVADWTGHNQPFHLNDADAGKTTGRFIYDNDEGVFTNTSAQFAFFPWQGYDSNKDNNIYDGTMYFKMRETYDSYTSGQMLTPLVATMSYDSQAGDYEPIDFKHAGAAIKLVISNLSPGCKSAGIIGPEGSSLWGTYSLATSAVGSSMAIVSSEAKGDQVWLHFNATTAQSTPFTFIFPVPTISASKLTFKIYDKNDVLVWSRSTTLSEALKRADVLEMPDLEIIPYKRMKEVSTWGVVGLIDWNTDIPMVTDGESSVLPNIHIAAGSAFKIRQNGSWENQYGGTGTDGNYEVSEEGDYDIILSNGTIKVVPTGECPYPAVPHHSSITDATNLGATETANCYVLTTPGSYKIPVVKGNSSTSAGTVGGVQLLWETYNNATDVTANSVIAAVDYDDDVPDYIFFKTPDTLVPGNALIAAKDADGKIIWSWHIWIPATAIEEVGSYSVSAKYLMDRNLGALKATVAGNAIIDITSIGLYYQWGRKDPFVGPREIIEGEYPSKAKVAGIERTADKVQISLAESIAQPTFFARGEYSGSDQVNPDWCSDQNAEYWGDSGNKSIYDPCPAGYRVPKRDKAKLLWADSVTGYEYSADYYWFKVGDPAVVFPAAGWMDGGSIKTTCRFGLWNAHNDSYQDPNTGSSNYAGYARRFEVASGSVTLKNSSVPKSLGYAVRCESVSKAVPEPATPDLVGATNVILDGQFSDWTSADAVTTDSGRLPLWKFGLDASNLYFYYKIDKSKIKYNETSGDYAWASYIYVGIDTDNDSTTGARIGGGTDMETGGEVKLCIFPWRGNYNDNNLSVVNGVDNNGYIQRPVGTELTDAKVTVYGTFDDNYCYLEVGIPRSALGTLASKIAVAHAMDYSTTAKTVIPIN
ncbi:MAG: hypothetical protein J5533_05035 [Bacteroidales bacterium]|nr:hypothetical protein [Bacteroidales bacterium]